MFKSSIVKFLSSINVKSKVNKFTIVYPCAQVGTKQMLSDKDSSASVCSPAWETMEQQEELT